ncbi:MAG: rhodanese-like domain-containing protein [Clostridiales bacterium]|nr:rhodanese-like domain-containing protein [Clostridiales bacterium]
MKKALLAMVAALLVVVLSACSNLNQKSSSSQGIEEKQKVETEKKPDYRQIGAQEAKEIMENEKDYVIVDVRTKQEYDSGHIPGAILLPNEEIATKEISLLPDKDQLILVYCRSGNRSKQASSKLVALGYTNIVEFGGINSWPYDIEK